MSIGETIRSLLHRIWNLLCGSIGELSRRQRWMLGLFNLSTVVILWVMSSVFVNDLVAVDGYSKPFFITYLNTACFGIYLIPYLRRSGQSFKELLRRARQEYYCSRPMAVDEIGLYPANVGYGSDDQLSRSEGAELAGVEPELLTKQEEKMGVYETINLSFQFVMLWFMANLVTNASLSYTSIASQTILSSTSSFFTLLLGFLYAVEKVNNRKICGILLSFIGVLIITQVDSNSENPASSPLVAFCGNMLALAGALIYGIYTILLKLRTTIKGTKRERILDTQLFFGFVGIFNAVLLWPMILLLHFTGVEQFELPSTSRTAIILLANMLITFISDFCWCNAVLLTSPLTVTTGLSLTIPLAMVCDWLIRGFRVNIVYLSGAVLVTLGFIIINRDEEEDFIY